MHKRLFVDIDGTLAEFKTVDTMETLFQKGYFYNLLPQDTVLNAVKRILGENLNIEVYILSSYLSDSRYALHEKNLWLDRYLPELDKEHRIFCPCGEDKRKYLTEHFGEITDNDFLLDDYSQNLHAWEPPGRGIKLLNGINGNFGTWKGNSISIDRTVADLADCICNAVLFEREYRDFSQNMNQNEIIARRNFRGR